MESEEFSVQRETLINTLTSELTVLRAKLGITQEELSKRVGISRQTYSSIESRRQKMTWITFMALLAFYQNNEATNKLLNIIGFFNNTAFKECLKYK